MRRPTLPSLPPLVRRVTNLLGAPADDEVRASDFAGDDEALVALLRQWRLAAEIAASMPQPNDLSRGAVRALAIERERVRAVAEARAATTRVLGLVLGGRGLRAMLLKGEATVRLTHGDASRRPMADVDVLVKPADLAPSVESLVAAGMERTRHDTPLHVVLMHRPDRQALPTAVEIHCDVLDPPHPFDLRLAALLARALPWREEPGSGLFVALPGDALSLACVHLVFHENDAWKTLLTLRDIAHLSRAVDWASAPPDLDADHEAVVFHVLQRAVAWAGADARLLSASRIWPGSLTRRLALAAALREMDAGLLRPNGERWRILGRRLGHALWWRDAWSKAAALGKLVTRARPASLERAARATAGAVTDR